MSIKDKTVSGLTWSFIDNFAKHSATFIFGIILARLLTPREFGLIGMTSFFVAFLQPFVISGLPYALIRKSECTQEDYSTVFIYNLIVSILIYLILFFSAGAISDFFNEPQLKLIIRVLNIGLIIQALSIVQGVILTKRIDFKLLTIISVISVTCSGVIGIFLAYKGFGVWSLVIRHLTLSIITSLLLWLFNKWRPTLIFRWNSFKEMFAFGWKLLVSGLLNQLQVNILKLVIGKFFSATDLGFYTRAENFKQLASRNITEIIERVTYPVLSSIQGNRTALKSAYRIQIKSTILVTAVLMIGMAAVAEAMILTLIGEQWLQSVSYLRLLSFVGIFYPLIAINSSMLQVQGRSDIILKLNIIKKILLIPVVLTGIFSGIEAMIIGMIFHSFVSFILNSYSSGKLIGYSFFDQLKDIVPSFLLAGAVGILVFTLGQILKTVPVITFLIQLSVLALLSFGFTELFRMKDYLYIKNLVMDKILKK